MSTTAMDRNIQWTTSQTDWNPGTHIFKNQKSLLLLQYSTCAVKCYAINLYEWCMYLMCTWSKAALSMHNDSASITVASHLFLKCFHFLLTMFLILIFFKFWNLLLRSIVHAFRSLCILNAWIRKQHTITLSTGI